MNQSLPLLVLTTPLLGSPAPAQGSQAARDGDLAISRVTVVDVERGRLISDQTVVVKGGRVTAVEPSSRTRLASGVRNVDGSGKYLIPGLLDMHVHLTGSGKATEVEMPLLVAHGVTGVRVMNADRPSRDPAETPGLAMHRDWQSRIEAGTLVGPRLLALSSWAVNGAAGIQDGMPGFYKATTREEGQQLARYFKERGFDFIKIYNNLSREGFLGLSEEARRLGLPFAGHEPGSMSAVELSDAGQRSIEHSRVFLLNCFPGADSLQRGLLKVPQTILRRRMVDEYDPARCAEVFRTFAKNRTYITPTHGTRKMDAFADDSAYRRDPRLKYVALPSQMAWAADANGMVASDSSRAGRRSYLDFYVRGRSLTNDAYRAGVPVMVGTDAGDSYVFPGSSVHDELGELVTAGLSPGEALRAATLSGAEYLGLTADLGSIRPGRLADLVLLDGDPLADVGNVRRIRAVILNGRVLERPALDSMLSRVEEAARPTPQLRLWAGAAFGDTAAIAAALDAGAGIDSMDTQFFPSGRRALNFAALANHGPAVRLLVARGASINLANKTGFTPVLHAVEGGAIEALRILIDAGADVTLATPAGVTALTMAQRRGMAAAVKLLEEAATKKP
jgi:imidazolonepropionase-like amidohydrolase